MSDFADIASAIEEQDREDALANQRDASARAARIAESMRGFDPSLPRYCSDCDEQIAPARLQIYPFAARCTECSSKVERKLRGRHG